MLVWKAVPGFIIHHHTSTFLPVYHKEPGCSWNRSWATHVTHACTYAHMCTCIHIHDYTMYIQMYTWLYNVHTNVYMTIQCTYKCVHTIFGGQSATRGKIFVTNFEQDKMIPPWLLHWTQRLDSSHLLLLAFSAGAYRNVLGCCS